jgi:WD40 repeat protein
MYFIDVHLDIIEVLRKIIKRMKFVKRVIFCFYICLGLLVAACKEIQPPEATKEIPKLETQSQIIEDETEAIKVVNEGNHIYFQNQLIISAENVKNIALLKNIFPFFPPIIQLSSDGNTAAVGDLSGIKVIDLDSNEILLNLNHPVPICNFGFRKYFQLNHDGSYIAITLTDKIEVWSVDEGLIFESPYKDGLSLDPLTCGGNIPQLGLSPDGKFLAESGLRYSLNEIGSYFRVTDIEAETIAYEWDVMADGPNGQFYTYPGLGFSLDGNVLVTFDPKRFSAISEKYKFPFRYFSTLSWQELSPNSKIVEKAFKEGDFQFAKSKNETLFIFDKRTGKELNSIPIAGCIKENPCDVIFSPNGTKMAVRHNDGGKSFKRVPISSMVSTYEILSGKKVLDYSVQSRSSESIVINDDGELVYFKEPANENMEWWTYPDYFSGFRVINEISIAFTPQIVIKDGQQQAPYSGSCWLDLETYSFECANQLIFDNEVSIEIEEKGEGITIFSTSNNARELIADIRNPQGEEGDQWLFRLISYSPENGTGFFCVDRNLREDSCFIMDMNKNEILHDRINLTGIQYSAVNQTAVFIDQNEKALFLFSDEKNSLKRINTYQATALPIKPAYLSDGIELIYLVKSLENKKNAYIERIDSDQGKVIKRYAIEEIRNKEIKVITASPKEDIWAVADKNGRIFFIDPEEQAVVFSFQAMDEEIVDMIFSPNGKSVLTIGRSGIISIWVVEK